MLMYLEKESGDAVIVDEKFERNLEELCALTLVKIMHEAEERGYARKGIVLAYEIMFTNIRKEILGE